VETVRPRGLARASHPPVSHAQWACWPVYPVAARSGDLDALPAPVYVDAVALVEPSKSPASQTPALMRLERACGPDLDLHWFETELLTRKDNLIGLMALNRDVLAQADALEASDRVVLDMDSSESPAHGQQEGSAYNGHFEAVCDYPLFLFNGQGDCLAAKLRQATCTVLRTGTSCWCRRSSGNRRRTSKWLFGPTRPLPNRRSTKHWKSGMSRMRSGFRPMRAWNGYTGAIPGCQMEILV